ncbi:hypothetical protein Scep_028729 [Stephania cephalantha]|uniref:Pectinesterase n=1 Tax=Stephania cephalantha TaxID=152367 RepID=A0AAP0EDN8_9MAGN
MLEKRSAFGDCMELMSSSIDRVLDSKSALQSLSLIDAQAWLSTVLTNHVTCLNGLDREESGLRSSGGGGLDFPFTGHRKRSKAYGVEASCGSSNVVVAQMGVASIRLLVRPLFRSDNGKDGYVIYVKKGTYKEKVEVGKKKKNVMIVGDDMDSTIIT